jgi:hypothetical protein
MELQSACFEPAGTISMVDLVSIVKEAKTLGVSEITLRRQGSEGKLPSIKTEGGHRRHDISKLRPETVHKYTALADGRKAIAYARAPSHEQKSGLGRLEQALGLFGSQNGWTYKAVSDVGSGMDYQKKAWQSCSKRRNSFARSFKSKRRGKIEQLPKAAKTGCIDNSKRIAGARRGALHRLTAFGAVSGSVACIENLNIKGMLASRKLAKHIADGAFLSLSANCYTRRAQRAPKRHLRILSSHPARLAAIAALL